MTGEERAALDWLDRMSCNSDHAVYVRALQAMLAEPRLPAEPTQQMLWAMDNSAEGHNQYARNISERMYFALHAHLTKPKTKTVWRVLHQTEDNTAGGGDDYADQSEGLRAAADRLEEGYQVTILKREVPA